ncbi:hypothetical protein [Vibrio aquimaris]|uniref:Uncharacterized protein n=1 Tax=Vibrio aquimaris TaxID=2587862 RepID=A0A5P9CMX7_9VIBR|nr:hypothetical protein [Vibrio aquimaris]QFT27668.1 hypothetical protein FIV01_14875 [Vibrio aquimaris]
MDNRHGNSGTSLQYAVAQFAGHDNVMIKKDGYKKSILKRVEENEYSEYKRLKEGGIGEKVFPLIIKTLKFDTPEYVKKVNKIKEEMDEAEEPTWSAMKVPDGSTEKKEL